jgi:chromatin assembly factor 1 subunit B
MLRNVYHYIHILAINRSPDGQCLMLSSRDGYCTIVVFDEILPTHHTQQHALQLQSIAHHHSVPITYSTSNSSSAPATIVTPTATPSSSQASHANTVTPPTTTTTTTTRKRPPRPLTPAASVDDNVSLPGQSSNAGNEQATLEGETTDDQSPVPPKKKRRVQLTRVGDLNS